MGTRLPSEREVLIIRPTGITGNLNVSTGLPKSSGAPARKPGIPKQDPNAMRSRRNAVAAQCG